MSDTIVFCARCDVAISLGEIPLGAVFTALEKIHYCSACLYDILPTARERKTMSDPIDRDTMFAQLAKDVPLLEPNTLHALRIWWQSLPISSRPTYAYVRELCAHLLVTQRDRDAAMRKAQAEAYRDAAAEK